MVGFVQEENCSYAGKHLLLDLYNCKNNFDMETIRLFLTDVCRAIGATVLFSHAHLFDGGGSSGAVILAESHCTWHQWPENNFIALDIFVCGDCDPTIAIPMVQYFFQPETVVDKLEKRGIL